MSSMRKLVAGLLAAVLLTQSMAVAAMPVMALASDPAAAQAESVMPCHGEQTADKATTTEAADCCVSDGCGCAALCAAVALPTVANGAIPEPLAADRAGQHPASAASAFQLGLLRPPISLSA